MSQTLVITLREGIEAALVVGIILAYLTKTGRAHLARTVYWGVGLAIVASFGAAILFQAIGFDPENEFLEGILMLTAGLMVGTLVVWMWRTARNIKHEVEDRLSGLVGEPRGQSIAWGLLAFTFLMVFREGLETMFFLVVATIEGTTLLDIAGVAVGLALVVAFAYFFIKGSLRIHLPRFFTVTSLVLLVLAVKLILSGIHEWAEVGIVPLTKEIMNVIGYIVRGEMATGIISVLLVIPVLLVLWEARSTPKPVEASAESTVERRRRTATQRGELAWRYGLLGVALAVVSPLALAVLAGPAVYDPVPQRIAATGDQVVVDTASLEPGVLHKFQHDVQGMAVRFLVFVAEDGTVSTSLDACQICGAAGYVQDRAKKNIAICKNCQAPIAMDTIGMGGGCNPMPLGSKMVGTKLTVPVSELVQAAPKFK